MLNQLMQRSQRGGMTKKITPQKNSGKFSGGGSLLVAVFSDEVAGTAILVMWVADSRAAPLTLGDYGAHPSRCRMIRFDAVVNPVLV